jgi:hypothetical protein
MVVESWTAKGPAGLSRSPGRSAIVNHVDASPNFYFVPISHCNTTSLLPWCKLHELDVIFGGSGNPYIFYSDTSIYYNRPYHIKTRPTLKGKEKTARDKEDNGPHSNKYNENMQNEPAKAQTPLLISETSANPTLSIPP